MPAEPCKTSELGTTGETLGIENHVGRALTPFRTKAMATPPTEPIKTARATLEPRKLPERMRIQEISISGQRRRTQGSTPRRRTHPDPATYTPLPERPVKTAHSSAGAGSRR